MESHSEIKVIMWSKEVKWLLQHFIKKKIQQNRVIPVDKKKPNLRPYKICGNESNKNTLVISVQMSQAFSCLPDYQPHPIKLPQPPTPQGLFQDLLHQSFSPNCGSEVDITLTTRQTSGFDKGGLISK